MSYGKPLPHPERRRNSPVDRSRVLGRLVTSHLDSTEDNQEIWNHATPEEREVVRLLANKIAGDDIPLRKNVTRAILTAITLSQEQIDQEIDAVMRFQEAFSENPLAKVS